jgi:hypothetical protein
MKLDSTSSIHSASCQQVHVHGCICSCGMARMAFDQAMLLHVAQLCVYVWDLYTGQTMYVTVKSNMLPGRCGEADAGGGGCTSSANQLDCTYVVNSPDRIISAKCASCLKSLKLNCRPSFSNRAIRNCMAQRGRLMCCRGVAILYSCFNVNAVQHSLVLQGRFDPVHIHYHTTRIGRFIEGLSFAAGELHPVHMHCHTTRIGWFIEGSSCAAGNCNPVHICYHTIRIGWFIKGSSCAAG